jgi:16S rRNA C1402 (ribose-2'-O) methylase RsmI
MVSDLLEENDIAFVSDAGTPIFLIQVLDYRIF